MSMPAALENDESLASVATLVSRLPMYQQSCWNTQVRMQLSSRMPGALSYVALDEQSAIVS